MFKQIRHITLVLMLLTGMFMMLSSGMQHTMEKPGHSVLKLTAKGSMEILAEWEEEENEQKEDLVFSHLPFLHYLYLNYNEAHAICLLYKLYELPQPEPGSEIYSRICVFRI